ncbi:nucleotidyl transferase AbiEii/AbiGii toxin family protein [soil metagenome]
MTGDRINITDGWIARHTPKGAGSGGRDAAVIDIAQDLLLRELHTRGALAAIVFKGGTALRKLYAGNNGRFSLDLDFSLVRADDDPDVVVLELVEHIDGISIGPFTYGVSERRGKWSLTVSSPFSSDDTALSSKLDVSPPVWIDPVERGWVAMPVHVTYGLPALPKLPVIRIEENIAEKISRLNRVTTARDMYDLAWLANHRREFGGLDTTLIRRLAVLKIWVDANGVSGGNTHWKPGHEPRDFIPQTWLHPRGANDFDLEDIGALAVPTPTTTELSTTVSNYYAFLADLDADEIRLSAALEKDRQLALRLLTELPGGRLNALGLY